MKRFSLESLKSIRIFRRRKAIILPGRSVPRIQYGYVYRDVDGTILDQRFGIDNMFLDEGAEWMIKACFEGETLPTDLHLLLDNRATIARADTLASLSGEPAIYAYARQPLTIGTTDWTASLVTNWQGLSVTATFSPSGGDWAQIQNLGLCVPLTGTVGYYISAANIGAKVMTDGQTLDATAKIILTSGT